MKVVDANILLYAVNRDAPDHAAARDWWERTLNGEEPVGLAWIVLLAFLRISTHPKVFPKPLTPDQALDRVAGWLSHGNTTVLSETERHWDIFRDLLRVAGTAGNLTTDAHLAAVAIGHGATLSSRDTDFARFPGLRWENPLAPRKPG